ncbi:unnamed protein product [Lepeophtheirus salmonis]|uniref:(salmon louse) hypothetical protein n=1 Tax=Lepeophtheirus salmonis TaxID=72036 RepID=A0A7R8CVJ3_LEPSM|nr:unnamed protein product [Lepeophtheirus salmonis]CAF2943720.1 unnamed protein product [Lepeophtheirus salmonis]
MLSVIHPSSTQHIGGTFRSMNSSYPSSESVFGFPSSSNPSVISSSSCNKYNNPLKWATPAVGHHSQQLQWPGVVASTTSSSSPYLFQQTPQYSNTPSNHQSTTTTAANNNSSSLSSSRNRGESRCSPGMISTQSPKDYSKPLFVDCSIEYELPNAPKIPKNSEPILMIHPAYKQPQQSVRSSSKRASTSTTSSGSSGTSISKSSSGRGGISNAKSKGVKRTHSQCTSTDAIMSNQAAALLQHQLHLVVTTMALLVVQPQHFLLAMSKFLQPRDVVLDSSTQKQQQQRVSNNYCCWLPNTSNAAAAATMAYYKAQIRMRQQESFIKSFSQQAAPPQGQQQQNTFCLDCVQGKCSQVAWNKENLGFMRSL